MKNLTLTDARNQFLKIADELQEKPDTVFEVLKRGKPVMTMLSSELYESLVETLEILGDDATSEKLRKALTEVHKGRGIPWKKAKKKLGIQG